MSNLVTLQACVRLMGSYTFFCKSALIATERASILWGSSLEYSILRLLIPAATESSIGL